MAIVEDAQAAALFTSGGGSGGLQRSWLLLGETFALIGLPKLWDVVHVSCLAPTFLPATPSTRSSQYNENALAEWN